MSHMLYNMLYNILYNIVWMTAWCSAQDGPGGALEVIDWKEDGDGELDVRLWQGA